MPSSFIPSHSSISQSLRANECLDLFWEEQAKLLNICTHLIDSIGPCHENWVRHREFSNWTISELRIISKKRDGKKNKQTFATDKIWWLLFLRQSWRREMITYTQCHWNRPFDENEANKCSSFSNNFVGIENKTDKRGNWRENNKSNNWLKKKKTTYGTWSTRRIFTFGTEYMNYYLFGIVEYIKLTNWLPILLPVSITANIIIIIGISDKHLRLWFAPYRIYSYQITRFKKNSKLNKMKREILNLAPNNVLIYRTQYNSLNWMEQTVWLTQIVYYIELDSGTEYGEYGKRCFFQSFQTVIMPNNRTRASIFYGLTADGFRTEDYLFDHFQNSISRNINNGISLSISYLWSSHFFF